MIVAKYKFNPSTYANYLPEFNSAFTNYTTSDATNEDGTITRTIESDTLPSYVVFGNPSGGGATDKTKALLEVISLDLSNVSSCFSLFLSCTNLKSALDIKLTSKTTNTSSMFNGCSSLTSLDLSNFDISNVTNMAKMFYNCSSLTSLDVSKWNTSKVTSMDAMFLSCSSLTSLDVINWDTSQATNMQSMFNGCSSLTTLDLSNWDTSKVVSMSYMFRGCSKLVSLDVSNWNTSQVTNMSNILQNCSSLTTLDVSKFNTSRVTNMSYMFQNCSSLTTLDVSKFNTSKVTSMNSMFSNCPSLTSLDISNWDTSRVTNMNNMFSNCSSLTTLDISNWNINSSTDINRIFLVCNTLYKINLKYANESTVSKIHESLPNRTSTTKGYILASVDLTSNKNWQIIKSSHNRFYLPQPLCKIGDIKDRLYWDENKGHYCIEQLICRINIADYNWWKLDSSKDGYDTFILGDFNKGTIYFPTVWGGRIIVSDDSVITSDAVHLRMKYPSSRFNGDVEKFKEYCLSNGVYALLQRYGTNKAITIDLPHLNQKLTFDSYNPSTTIDIPNRPLKASKTYLDAPIARYRYTGLQPSTQYNVQFDCKGDSGIKVNLGGTEVTFTPTSEWTRKSLTITTPSELVNDKLSISNVGITSNNKVDNVMLFSEVIAQEPDYIDAIQSIGELQDNGTYKIDIKTKDNFLSVYDNGYKDYKLAFENGSKEENNMLKLAASNNGCIKTYKKYKINKNSKILAKIVNVNYGTNGSYEFKFYLNGNLVKKVYMSDIYSSINSKGYYLFEYEITTDGITSELEFRNYFGEYYISEIAICEPTSSMRKSTHFIYLPQPLRKVGNIKDKFYWDYDKGHYCIEQNVGQVVLDGSKDEDWNITESSGIDRINTMAFRLSAPMMGSVYNIKCDKFITCSRENSCYDTDNEGVEGIGSEPYYLCLGIKKSKLSTQDVAGLRQWLSSNPTTVLYVLETPIIIDLPEMNKKFSFDTYLPNTSIDVTNLPLQPYGLLLEDDTVRYKSTIEPSTLYTIQFNCVSKLTTNLTLDLGGTRKTVDPIIGVNHVQITTPSVLASDRLFLIGTGVIVKEVIVNKGNMNQYTKYFDGEQSVGELQTDGSYIIRISTDNYTNLWEGDL